MAERTPVIMVAEDEADLRWLYQHWLSEAGYHVRTVDDGAWALALVPPDPPDLMLVDLNLPQVDGLEVCRRIKSNPALQTIPVLTMSSRVDQVTRDQVRSAGSDGFLVKPFSRTDLVAEVEKLIGSGRADVLDDELQAVAD